VTVYVTGQVVGRTFALGAGVVLLEACVPVWGAVVPWLVVSAYLSRKRLPSEALGAGLQLTAVAAVLAPVTAFLPAFVDGTDVTALPVATKLFTPVLVLVVVAGVAYVGGLLLKRRAERKLTRRARKDVYRHGQGVGLLPSIRTVRVWPNRTPASRS
jgi:hypothetical protein